MDTLVQLTNVSKRHGSDGSPAVAQVCMEVVRGESVAIMGPSGSGKSTLLNLIAGLDRPTSGTVTVGGQRIDTLSETGVARYRRRQVGMIFQFFNLLDDMTVMAPPVGRSRPAIKFSNVDLPLPDGPMIATDSPQASSILTCATAGDPSLSYRLLTSVSCTKVSMPGTLRPRPLRPRRPPEATWYRS